MTGSEWLTALSLMLNTVQVLWLATLRAHQKGAEAQIDALIEATPATGAVPKPDPRTNPTG